jgi:hypothetical protein
MNNNRLQIAFSANAHIRATLAAARLGDSPENPRAAYCRDLAEACEAAIKADAYFELANPVKAGIA